MELTEQNLRQAYLIEGLTYEQMKARFGKSVSAIRSNLKKFGITEKRNQAAKMILDNKDELLRLYNDEGLSLKAIGKQIGVDDATVLRYMKKHNIQTRSLSSVNKARGAKAQQEKPLEFVSTLLEQGESLMAICEKHGLDYYRMYYGLKKIGCPYLTTDNNGKSEASLEARAEVRKVVDKEELDQLYTVDGLTVYEIAKIYDTTPTTVAASLRRFNIPVRLKNGKYAITAPRLRYNTLFMEYHTNGLSGLEIAAKYNNIYANHGNVIEDLKRYNILRRTYKQAGTLLYEKHPEKRELHRIQLYSRITGRRYNRVTCIEQSFMDWANEVGLEYDFQFQITPTTHRYDFLVKGTNCIVEMDGDYWHSTAEQLERDAEFDKFAQDHGYHVIRIRQSELQKDADIIFNKRVKGYING